MFQFRRFPSYSYVFTVWWPESVWPGFPIRISADRWIFASPRRFSQLITSFIGSQCQGIHPALFIAWPFLRMYSVTFNGWFFNNCFALFLDVTSNKEITGYFDVLIFFINVSMCSFQGTVLSECYYTRFWPFGQVEITRFELVTPCLQGRCSPNWAIPPK